MLARSIFKAYDVRGIVGDTLTDEVVFDIGRAVASDAREHGQEAVVIGRDGRLSGPAFAKALAEGVRAAGLSVIDIGRVATPMLYFATNVLETQTGIMITGSHNPPEYNGLKMVIAGEAIYGERIQSLYERITGHRLASGQGGYRTENIEEAYLERIVGDAKLAVPMHIAVDCGNGVAGAFAPELYRRMGATVTELYCEVDGTFPNHHPDPAHPENLADLIERLRHGPEELGLAFDGDGDRLGVVTKDGQIIYPDRQLMLFAEEVLGRNPGGTVIYDVKCTRNVGLWVKQHGGEPLMWKTGHSLIKAKLRELGAPLAGEMSGHIFFKDRWYGFDDGLYAGARLLEILARAKAAGRDPGQVLNALPNSESTPELQLRLPEGENFRLIETLQKRAKERFAELGALDVALIDGVRVEYRDGFGLARASNTTPVVVLRFEGDSATALKRIMEDFRRVILEARPDADLPY